MPKVTFADAISRGFKNFVNFKGVATRAEFWYFQLFVVLVSVVLSTFESIVFPIEPDAPIDQQLLATPLSLLASLILFLPQLSLQVRRFHDAGFSGKWLLLLLPALFFVGLTFGAYLAVESQGQLGTITGNLNIAGYAYPTLMILGGIQIFFLIVMLQPSKPASKGNKYAPGYDPDQQDPDNQNPGSWQPRLD